MKGKRNMKKKRILWIGGTVLLCLLLAAGGYALYRQHQQQIYDSITLSFVKDKQLEYGENITSEELIEKASGTLIKKTEPDMKKIGKQKLSFTLEKEGIERTFPLEIEVKDTQKPVITLKKEKLSLEYGASFDPKAYVKQVHDPVDGKLAYAKEKGKKGTYAITQQVDTKKAGTYTVV